MAGRWPARSLWVLMATVFVDMIGFLMVLPLLPFYAERLGADAQTVGALVATFAFAQLATAALWGRLSDRYGRRPMILTGLLASALAYVLFGLAGSVGVLFLSRLVQGAGGGTTGVVQAYVSDAIEPDGRAEALGWITAATSAGVMIGPAFGSLTVQLGTAAPGFFAAALCVANMLFAWRWLPEPASHQERGEQAPGAMRRAVVEVLRHPTGDVGALTLIYSAGMMAFMAMNGVIALYLERRFGVDEQTMGWFYVYVGGVSLVMRTLALGPAVRRFGEAGVLRLGTLSLAAGLGAIPLAGRLPVLAVAMLLIPVGTALLFPATTSLLSRRAPARQTGLTLGVQQAFGGVSRMLGPIWAGAAFQHLGIATPFWIAGGLMLLVRLFASVVPEPRRPQPAAAKGAEPPLPPA